MNSKQRSKLKLNINNSASGSARYLSRVESVRNSQESGILNSIRALESTYGDKIKRFTDVNDNIVKELSKSVDLDGASTKAKVPN